MSEGDAITIRGADSRAALRIRAVEPVDGGAPCVEVRRGEVRWLLTRGTAIALAAALRAVSEAERALDGGERGAR